MKTKKVITPKSKQHKIVYSHDHFTVISTSARATQILDRGKQRLKICCNSTLSAKAACQSFQLPNHQYYIATENIKFHHYTEASSSGEQLI